jgi:hypothetical protein
VHGADGAPGSKEGQHGEGQEQSGFAPNSKFEQKWLVAGATGREDDLIRVVVTTYQDYVVGDDVQNAFGHERGHAKQFAQDPDVLMRPRFDVEVEAWSEWVSAGGKVTYRAGTLILDALNGYRRSLDVKEMDWLKARAKVEAWCSVPALSSYVPLEPDPGDSLPCHAGPLPPLGDGEGKPDKSGTVHDATGHLGERVGGESGKWDPGDGRTTGNDDDDDEAKRIARDSWLHTQQGMKVAARGQYWLKESLDRRGWDMESLPAVTNVALEKAARRAGRARRDAAGALMKGVTA